MAILEEGQTNSKLMYALSLAYCYIIIRYAFDKQIPIATTCLPSTYATWNGVYFIWGILQQIKEFMQGFVFGGIDIKGGKGDMDCWNNYDSRKKCQSGFDF